VVSGLTVRNTALHVSPCLAYLVSSLSSSRGNEGMRLRRPSSSPNRPQPCKFLGCLLLARRSNDVLVKSQESKIYVVCIGYSGIRAGVMSTFVLLGNGTPSSSSSLFSSF
jgi:hypothetical protein